MISVTSFKLASSILCSNFPFLGEKMRIPSSLHPEIIYFPFFGK